MESALTQGNIHHGATTAATHVGKLYKGGAVATVGKILVIGVFTILNSLFVQPNFKCPCISEPAGPEFDKKCDKRKQYARYTIIGTTVLAAFLGTAAIIGLKRKLATGKKNAKPKDNNGGLEENVGAEKGINNRKENRKNQGQAENSGEKKSDMELTELPAVTKDTVHESQKQISGGNTEDNKPPGVKNDKETKTSVEKPQRKEEVRKPAITVERLCSCKDFGKGIACVIFLAAAWVTILLIDGDYLACSQACTAYKNLTCAEIKDLGEIERPYTDDYLEIRNLGQKIGYGAASALGLFLLCALACSCKAKFCYKDEHGVCQCHQGCKCPWFSCMSENCSEYWKCDDHCCSCCECYVFSCNSADAVVDEKLREDYERKVEEAKKLLLEVEPQAKVVKEI